MRTTLVRTLALSAVLLLTDALAAGPVAAQIRASEEGTVSQTVDGTTLSIRYSRPRMRRRPVEGIFGKEVTWGEVWTPGANRATTLRVDKDVTINGTRVPAGAYSVWMVVQDADQWNTVLLPDTMKFHLPHPVVTPDMLQFPSPVVRTGTPPVHDLTWSIGEILPTGMQVAMTWADRRATLDVRVAPSLPPEVSAARAAPYLGRYALTWGEGAAPPGWVATAEVVHGDDRLRLKWPLWFWPEITEEWLIPVADHWYTFGVVQDGELFDVFREITFEFTVKDGRATRFDVRTSEDKILFSGVRQ